MKDILDSELLRNEVRMSIHVTSGVNRSLAGILFFCVAFLANGFPVYSQCKEWNWPADKAKAQEKFALFQDAVHARLYKQAIPHLNWFLSNTPTLNTAIYIRGAEVYDGLAKAEKDPDRKKRYADSLMTVYDLRLEHCGEAASVLNRKAMAYFKYNINGPDPQKVLALMDTAFAVNGHSILDVTLVPYMEATVVTKLKTKLITDEDVLSRYDRITEIIAEKIKANEKKREPLNAYQKQIDALLLKAVKVDCEFIHNQLEPKFNKQPADVILAKKILGYLLAAKCDPDQLWLRTAALIFTKERDFGLAKNIGVQFYALDSLKQAENYFQEALTLAPTASDKADVYNYLGALATKRGDRPQARSMFKEAIRMDPARKESFDRIGDLYYNSFKQCSNEKSMADDRMVYLLAYDYYERAGDQEKMHLAMKAFPSREEIFLMNYSAGQKVHVGCWIDEDTIIRTRD